MGKNILGLLLWLMVPAVVSCGGHQRELAQIERLLETNPSQADSLICTISMPKGKRAKALYAIISTQCDYKNYRDIPDDALIAHACNYYGTRKKSYHAAMAWYSRGCVLSLTDDDLGAIKSYLTARDLFPDTLNYIILLDIKDFYNDPN